MSFGNWRIDSLRETQRNSGAANISGKYLIVISTVFEVVWRNDRDNARLLKWKFIVRALSTNIKKDSHARAASQELPFACVHRPVSSHIAPGLPAWPFKTFELLLVRAGE